MHYVRPVQLSAAVVEYIERVVNRRDISAVDELVAEDYRGSGPGWPRDLAGLRAFYEAQYRERPDWRIDVQQTVELGASVVARASAGGTVMVGEAAERRQVEWLAHYRFAEGRITEINVLELAARANNSPS